MSTATMKAVRIHAYGGIEQVRFEDAPRPEPGPTQLRVKVKAASSNPCDWKLRSGWAKDIVLLPMPTTLGGDLAGVVDAVGAEVKDFAIGDAVFGHIGLIGAQAEYAIADAIAFAPKPQRFDFVQAAAVPLAGLTAWQALFDVADLKAGQSVLIHAAAGGVGSFAVQFAAARGIEVIATASPANHDYLRSLGASRCIDYRTQRVEDVVRDVDAVLDLLGGDNGLRSLACVKPGGVVVAVAEPPPAYEPGADGKRLSVVFVQPSGEKLRQIAALIDAGRVNVEIASVLPLSEAAQAHRLVERGHTRGKVVMRTSGP